jgi:NAD(P)-dependent dehydrogenase (short-subunit alcohol dehydrogenase family)
MKSALIIGASRGLGLGLVREHLARGWRVAATVRTPSTDLEALRATAGGQLVIDTLDIAKPEQSAALAQRLSGQKFDLLFLNGAPGMVRGAARHRLVGVVADR